MVMYRCTKKLIQKSNGISIVIFTLFLSILCEDKAFSVGGISNSKVIVPSAETVPTKHVEFEPFSRLNLLKTVTIHSGSERGAGSRSGCFRILKPD